MMTRKWLGALIAGAITAACMGSGSAAAAFPNFADCPRSAPGVTGCIHIQALSGELSIKGFTVPLGASLEIRGGLVPGEPLGFVPPAGTTGFFARPVRIPGGILGIDWPIPGNAVAGTAQLAGSPSQIAMRIGLDVTTVRVPIKLRLSNPILGNKCHIGTDRSPVYLNLTTGTTNPPPPNRPITGDLGRISVEPPGTLVTRDSISVDNAFSVPGASGCGINLGLVNSLINIKLGLPSAAGSNTMRIVNDVAILALG